MNAGSTQPFGRRGRAAPLAPPPMQFTAVPRQLDQLTTAVPPELVAALVHPQEKDVSTAAQRGEIVPRSFLAAILAGLIVAILNAAANATFAAEAQKGLGVFSFGSANAPIVVALLLAGLWSGARTSAFCLLAAHWLLAAIDRTSHASYAIASGGAALVLALIMHTLGRPLGPGGLGMEIFSGIVAGLFYRLFAGTKPKET